MTTTSTSATGSTDSMAEFDATTSRWGRATMTMGLLLSLGLPAYLFLTADLGVTTAQVATALAAVAASFGVFWVLEPLTYYPVLGPAAMYQAFMIGNISNKLLPAAVVAQSSLEVRPGTRKGDLVAVLAICGAATVHLTSLLVFVGVLGNLLLDALPTDVLEVVRTYILPSLMGAVLVQAIMTFKNVRITVIALAVALTVQFVLVPVWADAAMYAVAITVLMTAVLSWVLRDKNASAPTESSQGAVN